MFHDGTLQRRIISVFTVSLNPHRDAARNVLSSGKPAKRKGKVGGQAWGGRGRCT